MGLHYDNAGILKIIGFPCTQIILVAYFKMLRNSLSTTQSSPHCVQMPGTKRSNMFGACGGISYPQS